MFSPRPVCGERGWGRGVRTARFMESFVLQKWNGTRLVNQRSFGQVLVIPAKAGIHFLTTDLDTGFCRYDENRATTILSNGTLEPSH